MNFYYYSGLGSYIPIINDSYSLNSVRSEPIVKMLVSWLVEATLILLCSDGLFLADL